MQIEKMFHVKHFHLIPISVFMFGKAIVLKYDKGEGGALLFCLSSIANVFDAFVKGFDIALYNDGGSSSLHRFSRRRLFQLHSPAATAFRSFTPLFAYAKRG